MPGLGENAMVWFAQYWGTVGMIGLAAFSLVMLRSMIRSPGGPAPDYTGAPRLMSLEGEEGEELDEEAVTRLGRFSGSGKSMRDELAELVKEDPDAAANVLKNWIGNAG